MAGATQSTDASWLAGIEWMAWTVPTALFFAAIGLLLVLMTMAERIRPTQPRRGWLPIETTRGDRLFIALLLAAWIHIGWLATTDASTWIASALAGAVAVLVFRRG